MNYRKTFNKVIEEMRGIFVYLLDGISNFFKRHESNYKYTELNQSIMDSILYQDDTIPLRYNLGTDPVSENEEDSDSDSETICTDSVHAGHVVYGVEVGREVGRDVD